jgi:predicted RND superfamily exporter protein
MIASVALGLLVDNTMHLLYHYHRATQAGRAPLGALAQTVRHIGRAMIFTTLILTLGFWVGMLGSFKPTQYFALLTGLTLVVALGVALLLVPAVLLTLARRST